MLRILGTIALLMIGGELPAFAQAAIQEPGAYAFYHPNADVLSADRPISSIVLSNERLCK
jgi:hypothetical protein